MSRTLPIASDLFARLMRRGANLLLPVAALMFITAAPAYAQTTPPALDDMMVLIIQSVAGPIMQITKTGAFIFGIYMVGQGLLKAIKYADDGSKSQKLGGVYGSILIGAMLCSLPGIVNQVGASLFANGAFTGQFTPLSYAMPDPAMLAHLNRVYTAILLFVQMIGLISFVRGLSILRQVTDGNTQVTSMAGITHILAGAIAWNLSGFIDVLSATLGVSLIG